MRWWHTLRKLIVIEETLFGLPLALMGALLPFMDSRFIKTHGYEGSTWFLMILAFIFARTSGMSFNRLIDRNFDALNPRTKHRPLPQKEISSVQVAILAWVSLVLFIVCCFYLNYLCFVFSFFIAFLLVAYSYTKRFTSLCHFVIGLIEFFAPLLGWIAVTGSLALPPLFLGGAVLLWISGMDIMYATQDVAFDRQYRLHSIPVSFGINRSLLLARLLHGLSVVLLVATGLSSHANGFYFFGVAIVMGLFIYQHRLIKPGDLKQMRKAFFTCNSLIAVTQLLFTSGAIVWNVSL